MIESEEKKLSSYFGNTLSCTQVDEWLKKSNLPRLSLPVICGYIPLVRFLASSLMDKKDS